MARKKFASVKFAPALRITNGCPFSTWVRCSPAARIIVKRLVLQHLAQYIFHRNLPAVQLQRIDALAEVSAPYGIAPIPLHNIDKDCGHPTVQAVVFGFVKDTFGWPAIFVTIGCLYVLMLVLTRIARKMKLKRL